jgi:hypothetical protein
MDMEGIHVAGVAAAADVAAGYVVAKDAHLKENIK